MDRVDLILRNKLKTISILAKARIQLVLCDWIPDHPSAEGQASGMIICDSDFNIV